MTFDEIRLRRALRAAWSLESAKQWSADNPANGQCNVTAAVVCDLFGGEVMRTELAGIWHYYNRIGGQRYDLTDSQFSDPGARFDAPDVYEDALSSVADAMEGIPQREYDALRAALLREWAAGDSRTPPSGVVSDG